MKSVFYVILRFFLLWPLRLFFRIRRKGHKNEPKRADGPYLVCANHQSLLDPIFIALATKRQQPHFMAKAELFRVPIISSLVRWLGAFPVSRGKGDVGAIKHTIGLLQSGRSVGMFPQGTRCPEKNPRDCKVRPGAGMIVARAKVQVLPVHIRIKNYKWRLFRRVEVIIGEPIPFESFNYQEGVAGEYNRITEQIYEEICRLGEESK
ncbi:MAG: 1-acyl-sn-glycerol-3-phosphate acyltransferase [Clostridia bacterium]|nr:1-acyl-sn-glycerol-3-phosphate acyltransferase [Clostridia bacterium]